MTGDGADSTWTISSDDDKEDPGMIGMASSMIDVCPSSSEEEDDDDMDEADSPIDSLGNEYEDVWDDSDVDESEEGLDDLDEEGLKPTKK